jgi:hypothetical protein
MTVDVLVLVLEEDIDELGGGITEMDTGIELDVEESPHTLCVRVTVISWALDVHVISDPSNSWVTDKSNMFEEYKEGEERPIETSDYLENDSSWTSLWW